MMASTSVFVPLIHTELHQNTKKKLCEPYKQKKEIKSEKRSKQCKLMPCEKWQLEHFKNI